VIPAAGQLPNGRGLALALLAAATTVAGCTTGEVTPPPSAPAITAIGILAEERIADPNRTYILADGRTFEISIDQTRVLFEGGLGRPFVAGTDANGPFVAVFAHQDGLPDACNIAGIGAFGTERGAFIEIKGVLWRKAATFHSSQPLPGSGQPFDTAARFCFNDQAEITSAVP
jgi:hypothetical protein